MEIERKFLVSRLPDAIERYPHTRMEQAYVSVDPLIRVRRAGERYTLTCKGRGLLAREEFELDMTAEAYGRLSAKADGARIVKDRYKIPLGAYTVELDVFQEPLAPLILAEVEFPTEEAARAFAPPDLFGREVTYDPAYTNAALSQNGLPKEKYDPKDLQSVLLYVRGKFGAGIFEEPPRIFALFLDLAPDLKRDGNVLRQMSEAGLLRELRKASESGGDLERARAVAHSRQWLADYLMLSEEKANYFVTALQSVYGLKIEPSKSAPKPQAKPTPTPPKPAILHSGRTGDCTWTLDNNGVLTISGQGKTGIYGHVGTNAPWQNDRKNIKVAVIEYGVTSIGDFAFYFCENLKSVTLPNSVTFIGKSAFARCYNLVNVTLPDSVTLIEEYAFMLCKSLRQVSVSEKATISPLAFPSHTQVIRRP